MASAVESTIDMPQRNRLNNTLTREDIMIMAQNEYARQLCKFTRAQLKKKVPCYTEQHRIGEQVLSSIKATHQ